MHGLGVVLISMSSNASGKVIYESNLTLKVKVNTRYTKLAKNAYRKRSMLPRYIHRGDYALFFRQAVEGIPFHAETVDIDSGHAI